MVGERSPRGPWGVGTPKGDTDGPSLPGKQPSGEHVDTPTLSENLPGNFIPLGRRRPSGGGGNESTSKVPTESFARTNGLGPRSQTHTREGIFTLLTAIYSHRQKRLFIPEALFLSNIGNQNAILIKEAIKLQIPVIGVLDSDSNPFGISFPIPGNDDSSDAIGVYTTLLLHACTQSRKTQIRDIGVSSACIRPGPTA